MRHLHMILAVSLIFGIMLQTLLQVMAFEWATFFFVLLNLTVPFWLLQKLQKHPYKTVPVKRLSFRVFCEIVFLVIFTFPVIQIIGHFVSYFVNNPLKEDVLTLSFPLWLSFVVVAPLIEEFFFRGLLLREYEDQGIRGGLFWMALWFGVYHLSLHQGLYTFLFALLLGGVMHRHQNIVVPILVHSGVNGLSYFSGIGRQSEFMAFYYDLTATASWTGGFQLIYIAGFILCVYLLYLKDYLKRMAIGRQSFKMDQGTTVALIVFLWIIVFYKS